MSPEAHLCRIGAVLDENYEYFEVPLPPQRREMYAEDLAHVSFTDLVWACKTYRLQAPPPNQTKKPPKPQDLLRVLNPELSAYDQAVNVATKIMWGVQAYGSWGLRHNRAKMQTALGDLAMAIIKQFGWESLCEQTDKQTYDLRFAKLRDAANAEIQKRTHTTAHQELAALRACAQAKLPADKPRLLTGIGDILQHMPQAAMKVPRGT